VVDLPHVSDPARQLNLRVPDTVASYQLESLLQAAPRAPLLHGLVDVPLALSHWGAIGEAGVDAAPLHLEQHVSDVDGLPGFRP
jgi:hypothetical protein